MTLTPHPTLGLEPLLARYRPVTLAELESRAALMDREDRKYVVPLATLGQLLHRLQPGFRVLEVEGRRSSRYDSTYFDTDDARLFRAHAQGRRLRYKVRTREYTDLQTRYVEVKLKGSRGRTLKVRQRCTQDEHLTGGPGVTEFAARAVGDQYGDVLPGDLRPSLRVSYERRTLVADDRELRLTIDTALVFRTPSGERVGGLADGLALLEVKSPAGRDDVDALLLAAGVRPQSFSKYGLGLVCARPELPSADLRRSVARYVDVAGPAAPARTDGPSAAARVGEEVDRVLALARREADRIVAQAHRDAAALRGAGPDGRAPVPADRAVEAAARELAALVARRDAVAEELRRLQTQLRLAADGRSADDDATEVAS